MNRNYKQDSTSQVLRIGKTNADMNFVVDVLLPDFLVFAVGITAGMSLMLFLFQQ